MAGFTVYTREGNLKYSGEGYYFLIESNGTLQVKRSFLPTGTIIQGTTVVPQTIAAFNRDWWVLAEYDDV